MDQMAIGAQHNALSDLFQHDRPTMTVRDEPTDRALLNATINMMKLQDRRMSDITVYAASSLQFGQDLPSLLASSGLRLAFPLTISIRIL